MLVHGFYLSSDEKFSQSKGIYLNQQGLPSKVLIYLKKALSLIYFKIQIEEQKTLKRWYFNRFNWLNSNILVLEYKNFSLIVLL
jgi:hypothetical protein